MEETADSMLCEREGHPVTSLEMERMQIRVHIIELASRDSMLSIGDN